MQLLKENGFDLKSPYIDRPAALRWAATYGHVNAVRLLLAKVSARQTADPDGVTALHLAARAGNNVILALLLNGGAPTEARMTRIDNSTDRSWGTPLLWAAMEGHIETIEVLLTAGAQINARNAWNRTPLHVAARFGHVCVVRLLIDRGADKEARRDTNETPLHFAVEENHILVVTALLDRGVNINARGNRGTPLRFATTLGRSQIAQLLISRGAR